MDEQAHPTVAESQGIVVPDATPEPGDERPYFDVTYVSNVSARNARELGHWILGRLAAEDCTNGIDVRIPEDRLAGVLTVLVEAGFAVEAQSGGGSWPDGEPIGRRIRVSLEPGRSGSALPC